MPTGRTTSLDLALPVEGELDGTWGDEVNNGITDYVDIAVAGTLTLSGDGAVTLAKTQGSSSGTNIGATTAQYAIVRITGALTTTKVITAPSVSKTYVIDNAATGGAVTFKASGETGVSVAVGEKCTVYFNGTDFVKTASSVATALTGILPVANGGTGASTLTANNVILGNGTSAVSFVAPGTNGNVLTSNGTTWGSVALPAGGLTYIFTSTPVEATDKQGVLTDTSASSFTVTLPPTPSTGAQVVIADAGASWGTNNLTVARNGSTIGGLAEDLTCDITGASVQFVYDGTTWEVYAQIGGNGGTAVTLAGVQTLTNKTITYADNTLTGVAGTTATQTLTNKTIEDGTFTNGYTEETVTANTSTAYTIDLANGSLQILTLTGNCTFTFPTATAGKGFTLLLLQDATGSRTVTWPASVQWPASTAPTITATASKGDKYVFVGDGTYWWGSNAGQNYL